MSPLLAALMLAKPFGVGSHVRGFFDQRLYESRLPVDLKVDYDRDGEDDILGDSGDTIPEDEKFRFWINDDNDAGLQQDARGAVG